MAELFEDFPSLFEIIENISKCRPLIISCYIQKQPTPTTVLRQKELSEVISYLETHPRGSC